MHPLKELVLSLRSDPCFLGAGEVLVVIGFSNEPYLYNLVDTIYLAGVSCMVFLQYFNRILRR